MSRFSSSFSIPSLLLFCCSFLYSNAQVLEILGSWVLASFFSRLVYNFTHYFPSVRLNWGCPLSSLKSSWQIASYEKIHIFQTGPFSLQLESLNVAFGKEFCSILFNWTRNVFFSSICLQPSYSRLIWLCEKVFPSRILEVWRACAGKEVNFSDLKKKSSNELGGTLSFHQLVYTWSFLFSPCHESIGDCLRAITFISAQHFLVSVHTNTVAAIFTSVKIHIGSPQGDVDHSSKRTQKNDRFQDLWSLVLLEKSTNVSGFFTSNFYTEGRFPVNFDFSRKKNTVLGVFLPPVTFFAHQHKVVI